MKIIAIVTSLSVLALAAPQIDLFANGFPPAPIYIADNNMPEQPPGTPQTGGQPLNNEPAEGGCIKTKLGNYRDLFDCCPSGSGYDTWGRKTLVFRYRPLQRIDDNTGQRQNLPGRYDCFQDQKVSNDPSDAVPDILANAPTDTFANTFPDTGISL